MSDHLDTLRTVWNERVLREACREQEDPRKRVHTDLLWRILDRHLPPPPCRILDAGAGTGRFSPLAKRGYRVAHLDLAPEMLKHAEEQAAKNGIATVHFMEGSITDLSQFPDRSFEVVVCVMNRLGVITESGVKFDLQHFGALRTVREVYATGNLVVTPELKELQYIMPSWHAFTPGELTHELGARGLEVVEISAPGTRARFVDPGLLTRLFACPEAYAECLAFEEEFDRDPTLVGVGAVGAGGLAAVAVRREPR
ncbi:MAG: class I SAM-dependent methyltransferase [Candidatus Acetothermia bacterium]|jgi:SAM-dependent methyltransferase|nr:class I SAM-dependent methyltransferase [Candidatus Acetothermia bacterium]